MIQNLPRRTPHPEQYVPAMTAALRTPHGAQTLRPFQAMSLAELVACGGLFGGGRVGCGKTLTLALAPRVLGSQRPVIFVPAKHLKSGKAEREIDEYREHWQIPNNLRVESYHRLSTNPEFLDHYQPDFVGLDEVHALKDIGSSQRSTGSRRAKSFGRWLGRNLDTTVMGLTGTPTRSSLLDFAHILVWCLRGRAPVPQDVESQREWALCIDEARKRNEWDFPNYAALSAALGVRIRDQSQAREAFQQRLLLTPGVVISQDKFEGPLSLRGIPVETPAAMVEHWEALRERWTAPDGWVLADQTLGIWGVAQQFGDGFYYEPDPRPPKPFADARKAWGRFCRLVIETGGELDTESQVRDACLSGALPRAAWNAWAAVKDSYRPTYTAVWLHYDTLARAILWGCGGGIIWVKHRATGQKLSELTGWPYYGDHGKSSSGEPVDQSTARTIICSQASCGDGFNLQRHNRALFLQLPGSSLDCEQTFGRIHRDGQRKACEIEYLMPHREAFEALPRALGYATYTERILRQPQKLLQATIHPLTKPPEGPAFKPPEA